MALPPRPPGTTHLLVGLLLALGAGMGCSEGRDPLQPAYLEEPLPGLRALSFVLEMDLVGLRATLIAPGGSVALTGGPLPSPATPGPPRLSILGPEAILGELLKTTVDVEQAPRGRGRSVSISLRFRNLLKSFALTGVTQLPYPPPGVPSPVLVPWQTTIPVFRPNPNGPGEVLAFEADPDGRVAFTDSLWDGPAHDFFYGGRCPRKGEGCMRFKEIVEERTGSDTIGGLAWSEPVVLGWEVAKGVERFRALLVLVADFVQEYPPTPVVGGPYAGEVGVPLSFDGGGSFDPNGRIVRYDWNFGDGTGIEDAGPLVRHAYLAEGSYLLTLIVWDDDGIPVPAQTSVAVAPPSAPGLDVRWVGADGGPLSEARPGEEVRAQICSPLDLQLARGVVTFPPAALEFLEARPLDSSLPTAHPECRGEVDALSGSFAVNAQAAGAGWLWVSETRLSGFSQGTVGVAEIRFRAVSPGQVVLDLSEWELDPNDELPGVFTPEVRSPPLRILGPHPTPSTDTPPSGR